MATLRNKRKLAAVTRATQEEHSRNGQSRNTSVPRINEEYITQLSEELEGRVTKKLSQELSRTESRILGALSKLDEYLLNQQIQTHSETVSETLRNTNVHNQGTNGDDSQSDLHPEEGLFCSQTTQNSGPQAGHYSGKTVSIEARVSTTRTDATLAPMGYPFEFQLPLLSQILIFVFRIAFCLSISYILIFRHVA